MKCEVCGWTFDGDKCPICGYQVVAVVGNMPEDLKKMFAQRAADYRKEKIGNRKIYIRGYHWEDKDGKYVEKSREDFLMGEKLENMQLEQTNWGKTVFGKQEPGEKLDLDVVIETNGSKKVVPSSVTCPDTEGTMQAGVVMKPGFRFALVVGDNKTNVCTKELAL